MTYTSQKLHYHRVQAVVLCYAYFKTYIHYCLSVSVCLLNYNYPNPTIRRHPEEDGFPFNSTSFQGLFLCTV